MKINELQLLATTWMNLRNIITVMPRNRIKLFKIKRGKKEKNSNADIGVIKQEL